MEYDVAVIGLGPAGLEFVKKSIKSGLKIIAFEKTSIGGTCLNVGCIPTKTILSCSEVFLKLKELDKFGINKLEDFPQYSYEKMCLKKDSIVEKFTKALKKDFESKGVTIIEGEAALSVENGFAKIISNGEEYFAQKIIISTGSKPYELKNLPFNQKDVLNSDDVLKLKEIPQNILIIGSGAIGLEWAQIFSNLDKNVVIVEKADKLSPQSDFEVSQRIERILKTRKIKFFKNSEVKSYENKVATLIDGTQIPSDIILVAVGRSALLPNIEGDFEIQINKDYTTNIKNVYAIGDTQSSAKLAHIASYQAKSLFDSLYNSKKIADSPYPAIIYGNPEIASCGLREDDIVNPEEYKIFKLPLTFLPKAWCDNKIEGFIKIITKEGKIKGAHIIAPEASSLIMQIIIAMKGNLSIEDIKDTIFAHPTYSEGILEALNND